LVLVFQPNFTRWVCTLKAKFFWKFSSSHLVEELTIPVRGHRQNIFSLFSSRVFWNSEDKNYASQAHTVRQNFFSLILFKMIKHVISTRIFFSLNELCTPLINTSWERKVDYLMDIKGTANKCPVLNLNLQTLPVKLRRSDKGIGEPNVLF